MVTKDNLLARLELADRGRIISKGLKSSLRRRANLEKEKYGRDAILNDPIHPDGRPRYTQDEFERLSDDDKKQKLEEAYAFRLNKTIFDVVDDFSVNPEEALKEADKYSPELVNILSEKEVEGIINIAPEERREIMSAGAAYANYKKLKEDLEGGKAIHGENEKQLRELVSHTSAEIMYKYLEGYPEELRKLGAQYAALAPSEITRDNMIVGANNLIEKSKNELIKKYGADFEDKLAEAVGDTLIRLVRSGDGDKDQTAMELFYKAHKGYGIGQRDFSEVYK